MAGVTRNAAITAAAGHTCGAPITTVAADTLTPTAATTTEATAITATFPRITTLPATTAGLTTPGRCRWLTDGDGDHLRGMDTTAIISPLIPSTLRPRSG